jgi:DNA-binding transcriptional LysR family regulator
VQLHHLEYFVAVAETLSFTRGAARMHVVQSAVSAAVAQLESELDVRLFDRGHQSISLTAAAQALLPRAREVLAAVQAVADTAAATRGEIIGDVSLGTMAYAGPLDLAGTLERLQHDHPGVTVRVRQTAAGSRTSLEEVRSGALDLALVAAEDHVPGVEIDVLHEDPLVFVCESSHPLARRTVVALEDLAGEAYIEYPLGWGNRMIADHAFAKRGLTRSIRMEVSDFALATDLVARRLGVTFLPADAVPKCSKIVGIPIAHGPRWRIGIARASGRPRSAAVLTLVRYLRDAVL